MGPLSVSARALMLTSLAALVLSAPAFSANSLTGKAESDITEMSLNSPDGSIQATLSYGQQLALSASIDGTKVLLPSPIGMSFSDGRAFGPNAELKRQHRGSKDEIIQPEVAVRSASIPNQYNSLTLEFTQGFDLELRAFNQGIAYRFVSHLKGKRELASEQSEFQFAPGSFAYFPYEKHFRTATQPNFTPVAVKAIDGDELGSLPTLVVANGINVLLTETDLQNYPGLWIKGDGKGGLYGVHPQDLANDGKELSRIATIDGPRSFPWRILGLARSDAALMDNQLSYLLSEPSRIGKPDWIKPGKIAWDWYNENNLKGVDFDAGINTQTYKYYIDFAAKFGIENILIDDGWSTHEDVLTVLPGIDMQEIIRHGKAKGVAVQLWVPWSGLDKQMEKAMKRYRDWGITGLKIDFMNSDSQSMVNFYWRAAAMAARYQLMVNFHGSYKPAGIHRTYPNVMTREGVKGLENHKWSNVITPTHNLHLPFIRMIAGPMDYTPGAMRNAHLKNFNSVFSRPMSLGTRAHQLAMYVLYESPLQMLADTPSSYLAEPDIPAFISSIPTVWDEYRVLHASIGEYLMLARRRGDSWYIGAMTNEQPRTLEARLDFLPAGKYRLSLMQDGLNSSRHAEDYRFSESVIDSGAPLAIPMVGGGGFAAILTPL
ncbi:glycoside hydrolase family 97 protein [Shewanella sp. 3B26]|uniref:Glycoside hydrolase family 97 protein n=1 Tax=Shewanella zhuhaiensis TaxID=2919576 RepID=A0AAJ1BH31_9GAMM|nr:glycoside hydrolase family 97 protein [Shewanella zhuhaiensis]MCH4294699.1 glycoside hydrolase family 97 protein [Shewanella zhuhaiensis]